MPHHISRRPELSTVASQILPTRAIFAAALQKRQLLDAGIWLYAACRRVFPLSTKLRFMSTYFLTVTSLSTPCLSRKWLSDKKILHNVEASLETSALLPGKVTSCFHEIFTLQQNLHTSIEEKMHIILQTLLSSDRILRYYTGQATELHLGGCWSNWKEELCPSCRKCGQSQLQKGEKKYILCRKNLNTSVPFCWTPNIDLIMPYWLHSLCRGKLVDTC